MQKSLNYRINMEQTENRKVKGIHPTCMLRILNANITHFVTLPPQYPNNIWAHSYPQVHCSCTWNFRNTRSTFTVINYVRNAGYFPYVMHSQNPFRIYVKGLPSSIICMHIRNVMNVNAAKSDIVKAPAKWKYGWNVLYNAVQIYSCKKAINILRWSFSITRRVCLILIEC